MSNPKVLFPLDGRALEFLKQNPAVSQSILVDAGHDISRVATVIGPIFDAASRCESSSYYVQAVTTGTTAFLTTNLPDERTTHVTEVAVGWLIGRSPNCAISVQDASISRCHAVIGYRSNQGFYIIDVGSSNGTFVNGTRLAPMAQCPLQDGDVITLSQMRVEFLVSGWAQQLANQLEYEEDITQAEFF